MTTTAAPSPASPDDKETRRSEGGPRPAEADRGADDGLLDSIGKAISAPVEDAAEDDEPDAEGRKPPGRPG